MAVSPHHAPLAPLPQVSVLPANNVHIPGTTLPVLAQNAQVMHKIPVSKNPSNPFYVPPKAWDTPSFEGIGLGRDKQNLASLFSSLNDISMRDPRIGGGGRGGGADVVEGNMDANPLIALNPYMAENVTSFNQGGQLTPKEMKKVQKLGRFGDTQLAHINPQEAAMLKAMGGSGTINPYTGLRENWGFLRALTGAFDSLAGGVRDLVDPIMEKGVKPFFDSAGNLIDPALEGLSEGVAWAGDNLVEPAVKGIAKGSGKIVRGVGELGVGVTETVGGAIHDIFGNLLGGGDQSRFPGYTGSGDLTVGRDAEQRNESVIQSGITSSPQNRLTQLQKSKKDKLQEGDWVGDKDNPYVTPNVEEELDYAAQGMRMPRYNQGGHYTQQANQAIAQNQLSSLVANAMNRRSSQGGFMGGNFNAPEGSYAYELMNRPSSQSGRWGGGFGWDVINEQLGTDYTGMQDYLSGVFAQGAANRSKSRANKGMKRRYTNGGRV